MLVQKNCLYFFQMKHILYAKSLIRKTHNSTLNYAYIYICFYPLCAQHVWHSAYNPFRRFSSCCYICKRRYSPPTNNKKNALSLIAYAPLSCDVAQRSWTSSDRTERKKHITQRATGLLPKGHEKCEQILRQFRVRCRNQHVANGKYFRK